MYTTEKIKPNPIVFSREESDDGALLFDPDRNELLVINGSALLVWKQIVNGWDKDKLLEAFREKFNDLPNPEQLEADIEEILKTFSDKKFII